MITQKSNINMIKFNSDHLYVGMYNTLFEKTDLVESILNIIHYSDNEIIESLKIKYDEDIVKEQLDVLRDWFQKVDKHREKIDKMFGVTEEEWFGGKALNTLFMNISHDCNLRCVYCYGDGGNYGKIKQIMSIQRAKEIIDYWLKYLNYNDKIAVSFFGGEPLMNKKVLKFAVDYINEKLAEKGKKAKYSITTNGTILDEEILNILVKNQFGLTLSSDGGQEVHDKNRPTVSGEGSFKLLKDNIKILKRYYNHLSARLTLTHSNIDIFSKCVKDIWDIGVDRVMYDIVSTSNVEDQLTCKDLEKLKPQIDDLSNITYNNIKDGKKNIFKPLIDIGKDIHNKMFNPGCAYDSKKILMVDPEGDIFRCHRLVGDKTFNVGNIAGGLYWDAYNKHNKLTCPTCWANHLCHKCAQANYIANGEVKEPAIIWCEHRKMLISKSIELYIRFSKELPEKLDEIYAL